MPFFRSQSDLLPFLSMVTLCFFIAVSPTSVLADMDDEPSKPKCKRGYVYSEKAKKCVRKTSELLTDDDLYAQAVAHAKSGDFDDTLDLLWRIKHQKQPRVLNMLGYATRKKGDVDKGIGYYKMALDVDPNYVLAREYLGEGYLLKGKLALAKAELQEIETRCGRSCAPYSKLASKIDSYEGPQ